MSCFRECVSGLSKVCKWFDSYVVRCLLWIGFIPVVAKPAGEECFVLRSSTAGDWVW
jgi:hypothetical protein